MVSDPDHPLSLLVCLEQVEVNEASMHVAQFSGQPTMFGPFKEHCTRRLISDLADPTIA